MAFNFPERFRYADSHEYVSAEIDDLVRVGLSAFAIDQLGDIIFIDLPKVGDKLQRGIRFGSVESVKAVEEMYAPLDGTVVQCNSAVLNNPEELQNDPHGEGWLLLLRPSVYAQFEELMSAEAYAAKVAVF
ncbi:glycine cleavage system protein H [cyanobiont of Ornithocercus magnificus]|nr:glycine cleavage system protein H [cyanobiont of Ornithocercus magnificus]